MNEWNKCPGCLVTTGGRSDYYPNCGEPWTVRCPQCGLSWRFWKGYKFCPRCGTRADRLGVRSVEKK